MIRLMDIFLSTFGLLISAPLLCILFILGFIDSRSPIFLQERVGMNQKSFKLVKYRTMRIGTASKATHLIDESSITRLGHFLRKTKLDEIPQLWNVFKGDMSMVGPRPCLFNQKELIQERLAYGVFNVRPGITGVSQIMGIDMSNPKLLAKTDSEMVNSLTLRKYLYCIFATFFFRK